MQKFKMHGFKFPIGLLHAKLKDAMGNLQPNPDGLYFMDEESFSPVPSSALAVFLGLISKCDDRGLIRGKFKLTSLVNLMNINYNTIYAGYTYLQNHSFIFEELIDGEPVLKINNYEKYNTPERNGSLNYFSVPYAIFETSILSEFVRTSNKNGIKFMLELLNRFRNAIIHANTLDHAVLPYKMSTLKKKLNKNAKGVRAVLETLSPLFHLEANGLSFRKKQVWIQSYQVTLKEECVRENSDEFEINPLIAKYRKELTYFLDGHNIRHKHQDIKDIVFAFKQEVIDKIKYMHKPDSQELLKYRDRNNVYKQIFIDTIEGIQKEVNRDKGFTIKKALGAYFRIAFRNQFMNSILKVPRDLLHHAFSNEYISTGEVPALANDLKRIS